MANTNQNGDNRIQELEQELTRYSIGWNVGRISKLARSIMELAMYEIRYVEDVPVVGGREDILVNVEKYRVHRNPCPEPPWGRHGREGPAQNSEL